MQCTLYQCMLTYDLGREYTENILCNIFTSDKYIPVLNEICLKT